MLFLRQLVKQFLWQMLLYKGITRQNRKDLNKEKDSYTTLKLVFLSVGSQ